MIAVVDYGMGNLRSMSKALEHVGGSVVVTADESDIRAADRIVLPGVGAFGEAIANLRSTGLVTVLADEVLERKKPFLGVCVGMQLLADESEEHGRHDGLGWIGGRVVPFSRDLGVRVPHTGWNEVEVVNNGNSPLAKLRSADSFYFNHSYHFVPTTEDVVGARCEHGQTFVAALTKGNIVTTQFHPEKSQQVGLNFLADFVYWEPE